MKIGRAKLVHYSVSPHTCSAGVAIPVYRVELHAYSIKDEIGPFH